MTYEYTSPSLQLLPTGELIKQGAEGRVYSLSSLLPQPKIFWPDNAHASSSTPAPIPVILKHRFPKTYRHPTLDASLTRTRLQFEARALARAQRAGVVVPRVLWVDEPAGVLGMERVEGWSVREVLGGGAEGEMEVEDYEEVEQEAGATVADAVAAADKAREEAGNTVPEGMRALQAIGVTVEALMVAIGAALARLHATGIIHGDLTTSNMMVRLTPNAAEPYEIVSLHQVAELTQGHDRLWTRVDSHHAGTLRRRPLCPRARICVYSPREREPLCRGMCSFCEPMS